MQKIHEKNLQNQNGHNTMRKPNSATTPPNHQVKILKKSKIKFSKIIPKFQELKALTIALTLAQKRKYAVSPHWRDKAGVKCDPRHPTGAKRPVYSVTHVTPLARKAGAEPPAGGSTPSLHPPQPMCSGTPRRRQYAVTPARPRHV